MESEKRKGGRGRERERERERRGGGGGKEREGGRETNQYHTQREVLFSWLTYHTHSVVPDGNTETNPTSILQHHYTRHARVRDNHRELT